MYVQNQLTKPQVNREDDTHTHWNWYKKTQVKHTHTNRSAELTVWSVHNENETNEHTSHKKSETNQVNWV